MATPAPNSAAAANPYGGDHPPASCLDDPNFATICSFILKFGEIVRIGHVPFDDLQQMLENTSEVPLPLVQLHITLLRRVFKAVTPDKWERSLAKFGHMYCSQDAWEIERFGYKKARIQTKLRILKNLLEAQFDFNVKFKSEVNKLEAADLRLTPLGRDTEGQVYWYQVDADANLRVYREDIDDETWEIVASDREELVSLISQLQRGEVKKPEPEETIILPEEDSNSKDIEPKEIILDTGKVEDDDSNGEESEESEENSEDGEKPEGKTVEPLILKNVSCANNEFVKNKVKKEEVEDMELDYTEKVKQGFYENSDFENTCKVGTGLKLVFGVKSKPKLEPQVPKELNEKDSSKPLELSDAGSNSKTVELKTNSKNTDTAAVLNLNTEGPKGDVKGTLEASKLSSVPLITTVSEDVQQIESNLSITNISKPSSKEAIPAILDKSEETENKKSQQLDRLMPKMPTKTDTFLETSLLKSKLEEPANKALDKSKTLIKEEKSPEQTSTIETNVLRVSKEQVQNLSCEPKAEIHEKVSKNEAAIIKPIVSDPQSTKALETMVSSNKSDRVQKLICEPMKAEVLSTTQKAKVSETKVVKDEAPKNFACALQQNLLDAETVPMEVDSETMTISSQGESCMVTEPSNSEGNIKEQSLSDCVISTSEPKEINPVETVDNTLLKSEAEPRKAVETNPIRLDSVADDSIKKLSSGDTREGISSGSEVVCGKSDNPLVVEELVKKEEAWVCGKETPVVEETVTKEVAWVCGEDKPSDNAKVMKNVSDLPSVPSEDLTKTDAKCPVVESDPSVKSAEYAVPVLPECTNNPESQKNSTSVLPQELTEDPEVGKTDINIISGPVEEIVLNVNTGLAEVSSGKTTEKEGVKDANLVMEQTSEPNLPPISVSTVNLFSNDSSKASDTPEIENAPIKKLADNDTKISSNVSSSDKPEVSSPAKLNSGLVLYSESSEDSEDDNIDTAPIQEKLDSSGKQKDDSTSKISGDPDKPEKETILSSSKDSSKTKSAKGEELIVGDYSKSDAKTTSIEMDGTGESKKPPCNPASDGNTVPRDLKVDEAALDSEKQCSSTDLNSAISSNKAGHEESIIGKKAPDSASASIVLSHDKQVIENKSDTPERIHVAQGNLAKQNLETLEPTVMESVANNEQRDQTSSKDDTKLSACADLASDSVETTGKRKAEEDIESLSKIPRLNKPGEATSIEFNPIVGEAIEEEVMKITGEGSGALNEGSNENSPVPLAADIPGSHDESIESEESRDAFPSRGRGSRRGRGRRGRPPGGPARNAQPSNPSRGANRGLREVARLGVSVDTLEVNGDNERPVRASRRIAQIRLKEEEERRKLEEERLAQLKAAQMQKKAKQAENQKKPTEESGSQKSTPSKGKRGRKSLKDPATLPQSKDYIPSGSESEDNSEEGEGSDDYDGRGGKKGKRRRRKNGKAKKGGNPWATSDEEEDEEAVEEEEEYHYEEEEEELVFKSDHEFSPESDLGEDDDVGPSRHARTAKLDKGDKYEEGGCCKCGKGDHPEWILLCDKCDNGWHASCLRPQLWVVPEGEWFCPPCQHNMLIENLSKNLVEYEGLLKRRENEILRKQRLAYVGISLNNVLPDKEKQEKVEIEHEEKHGHERKKQRRRILSDEEDELSGDFINDTSDDNLSRSRSNSSDSEDEPVYRLRARRTKKAFDFKEYDDMINSALRVDDDEELEAEAAEQPEVDENGGSPGQINGESKEEEEHGGKNEAFLKHLEKQAQEEDETDEELLDEKERLRRKGLKTSSHRKTRRRINDLDAYSDEDSDDDFNASEAEDEDEEEVGEDGESEWSGDKMEEDSDDSIAKRAKRKERHGRLGRREKYSDKGLVRRSTRKRKSRISYDESDEDDDEEEDQADKWQSNEESDESESNSESDDSTWGKKKKKGSTPSKMKMSNFLLGDPASSVTKGKGKGGVKRKKRKTDEDDVDKAWNSARGRKQRDEPVERRTRGRKINFKDILDSGESDDDGNVRPKRRPLSDSEDSRSPSCSRRLAEEIRAENARQAKEYEAKKAEEAAAGTTKVEESDPVKVSLPEVSESLIAKSVETNSNGSVLSPNVTPTPIINQVLIPATSSPVASPVVASSPIHVPPSCSPLPAAPISSPLTVPPLTSGLVLPPKSSPIPISNSSTPPINSPPSGTKLGMPPAIHPLTSTKSPPPLPFPPAVGPLNLLTGITPKPILTTVPPPVPVTTPEKKPPKQPKGSRGNRKSEQQQHPTDLELALMKPVKTPPLPHASPKSSSKKNRDSPAISVPNPNLLMTGGTLPEILGQTLGIPSPLRPGVPVSPSNSPKPSSKKGSSGNSALSQPHGKTPSSRSGSSSQQSPPPPVSQNLSPSMPVDIDRVPNPALFQGNPGMRPFHPMWVRNPGPPPPGYSSSNSSIVAALGKPPPLNTSAFGGQQGPPPRPGYPSPPPLRIPNPNTSPLQAFQHFKRDSPLGGPLYRLPPGQPQPGGPLSNILPPGMMPSHSAGPERFFGAPGPYGHPYGLLPPHSQSQHPSQQLFTSPYDYRPPETAFKEEPLPPRTTSSSLPTPVSSASSSPPPTSSSATTSTTKDEVSAGRDSEFGGLVSYFSSQRSEEDMDT